MANVRDSDTSLWLHNKLGTSNDSWISGSICSQLNKEVLRNIKECFADLQTQVKLKLLLSFFHIPRRLVEEWKTELEEVIEAAGLDTELWVSMLAETMKTFPATSSLNTEISEYEDTRHIFTDMVNDLRKLVSKQSDLGMLPLECQYLNKSALISVVGQQPMPVKHFTLKRKPKSAQLRIELMHKSAEAQSSLKKSSAPTIPLRSRGMPRKMTDTTPMKGIPSRVPTTGGFRSPNVAGPGAQRPNLSRTPAGRKDGGIKIIDYTDQPLGFVAAKKRKREQQLEEQQKKEQQKAAAAAAAAERCTSPTPAGSSPQPTTPTTSAATPTTPTTIKTEPPLPETPTLNQSASSGLDDSLNDSAAVKEEDQSMVVEEAVEVKTAEDTGLANVYGGDGVADDSAADQAASVATTPQAAATPKASNVKAANAASTPTTTGRGKAKGTKRQNQSAKANAANATASPTTTAAAATASTVTNTTTATNNNNNNNNSIVQTAGKKRPKQTIEIKSEEIIVPPTIKLEKIDMPLPTVQQQQHQQQAKKLPQQQAPQQQLPVQQGQPSPQKMPRLQQRVIIQQQPPQQMPSLTSIQQPKGPNNTQHVLIRAAPQPQKQTLTLTRAGGGAGNTPTTIKLEKPSGSLLTAATNAANPLANLPNNISVKITSTKAAGNKASAAAQQQQQQPILINSNTPVILASSSSPSTQTTQTIRQKPHTLVSNNAATTSQALKSTLSQLKSATSSGPVIISQTIIQPAKRTVSAGQQQQQPPQLVPQQAPQQQQQQQQQATTTTKYIITSAAGQTQNPTQMPSLTSFTQPTRTVQQQQQVNTFQATQQQQTQNNTGQTTKILLKTSGGSGVVMTPVRQQQQQQQGVPTMLNLQNVQLPNRPVTIQPASQAAQQQHLQAQMQQQQQHTIVSNTTATQQPKLTQVLMQTGGSSNISNIGGAAGGAGGVAAAAGGVKNKTIILTPKGLIFRNISGDMYESIPISNVSGLQGLNATAAGGGGTGNTLMANAAGPPGLVKTQPQTIQLQTANKPAQAQQLPTLIPTGSMAPQHVIVQQQQTSASSNILGTAPQQTIIRPVISNVTGGLTTLPQGLTLIQRPGQQPQLLQVQSTGTQAQQQQQRTIIAQPGQQMRQQIVLQQRPVQQRIITTTSNAGGAPGGQQANQQIQIQRTIVQVPKQQAQQQPNQSQQQPAPQRRGLSLSNEHVHKAHEMFRKANRVSRPDKALILGFMAGLRENPRPNSENVIIIKLGETEEKVQQEDGSTSLCLVESLIRLDYNTGEWKTFQNYRRLDQSASQAGGSNDGGNIMQAQNSVVI